MRTNERAYGPGRIFKRESSRGRTTWVLDFVDSQGRRRRQPLSSDKSVAERRQREVIRQRDLELSGLAPMDGMNLELKSLKDLYLADLRTRSTPAHWTNASASLERTLREIGADRVRALQPILALKFRAKLLAEGLAPRTANLFIDRVRAMCNWGVKLSLIPQNPLAHIDRLRDSDAFQRYRRRALTDDEIERLLDAVAADDREQAQRVAREHAERSPRAKRHRGARVPQRQLFWALLETGCRWSEMTLATWADLDADDAVLTLRSINTKSRRERQIPLRRELVDGLLALRPSHHAVRGSDPVESDPIFLSPEGQAWPTATVNVTRILRRLLERAGIPRIDATGKRIDVHALRHSSASRMARSGVPIAMTQALLGHSDVRTTSRVYVHLSMRDLRDAIETAAGAGTPPKPRLVRAEPKRGAEHIEASA